jgi:DNA-binding FrmR family transcriptional regulator
MQNERQTSLWRLRSAEGHLHAVISMLEAECGCEKALAQLAAVRGAIDSIAVRLLNEQVEYSKQVILDDPSPERRCKELGRLVALFDAWRKSNLNNWRTLEEVNA